MIVYYSVGFVYPLPAGSYYAEPPVVLTDTVGTNWIRLYLAQGLALDVPPNKLIFTNLGFLPPASLIGTFVQVFDNASAIVIGNNTYSLTSASRLYRVNSVGQLDDHETEIAQAGANFVDPANQMPAALLSYVDSGIPYGNQELNPSTIDLVDNEFPFVGGPNPVFTGTYNGNPINDPCTATGGGIGGVGTTWYVMEGIPTSDIGRDGDLVLDAITRNVFRKDQGTWNLVANLSGGSSGGPGGGDDKFYLFTQTVPASTWNIPHSLNKYPSIDLEDENGNQIFGDVRRPTLNTATVTFLYPVRGRATFN